MGSRRINKIFGPKNNLGKYHRRSIRLKNYDYSQPAAYFITICTHNNKNVFGDVVNGKMQVNKYGRAVEMEWRKTASIRNNVKLDIFAVMPNHFHGIMFITNDICVGATRRVPPTASGPKPNSVGAIVGQFKSIATKRIRKMGLYSFKWQRNYYEHIIKDESELNRMREYILNNPLRWQFDRENPECIQDKNHNNESRHSEGLVYLVYNEVKRAK
jgi:putative transposase